MEEHGRRTWSGGRGRSGAENDRQIERLINHVKNLGHRLRLLQPVTEQSLYLLRWDPSYVNFARSNRSKRNRIRGKDFKGIEKKFLLFFSFFSCHNVRSLLSSWFFLSRIKKKKDVHFPLVSRIFFFRGEKNRIEPIFDFVSLRAFSLRARIERVSWQQSTIILYSGKYFHWIRQSTRHVFCLISIHPTACSRLFNMDVGKSGPVLPRPKSSANYPQDRD